MKNNVSSKYQNICKKIKNIKEFIWLDSDKFFTEYPKYKKSLKIKIKCVKCSYEFQRTIDTHLRGYGCPNCKGNLKITFDKFLKEFISRKINKIFYIKFDKFWWKKNYKNTETKLKFKCKFCKKIVHISYNNLIFQNARCKYCANIMRRDKNQSITLNDFLKRANKIHKNKYDYSLITEKFWETFSKKPYRTTKIKLPIICKKHGIFYQTLSSHLYSQNGCPKCSESKFEKIFRNYLDKNNIEYIYQYKIKYNNIYYIYDFYLPESKLLIEIDGQQHFYPVDFAGRGQQWAKENFRKTKKNDFLKNKIAYIEHKQLLRIPYWEINQYI